MILQVLNVLKRLIFIKMNDIKVARVITGWVGSFNYCPVLYLKIKYDWLMSCLISKYLLNYICVFKSSLQELRSRLRLIIVLELHNVLVLNNI